MNQLEPIEAIAQHLSTVADTLGMVLALEA